MSVFLLSSVAQNNKQNSQDHIVQELVEQDWEIQVPLPAEPELPVMQSPAASEIAPIPEEGPVLPDTAPAQPASTPDAENTANPEAIADVQVPAVSPANLVLIIDDIGYNADAGQRAINLPGQVTYAIIPFTPHGKTLAESANQSGKEVMLHVPMSNLSGMDLGQGGLTLLQNEEEFLHALQSALADIPHIKGVNNHTGSELTAAHQPMQWLMHELKNRGLFFVDSVTTNLSVAAATAEQFQVPSLRRHVFLDNVQTTEAIDAEFKRGLALAQKQGFAVAIGHPYAETLSYLETALPLLAQQNIRLISASSMISQLQKAEPVETTVAW